VSKLRPLLLLILIPVLALAACGGGDGDEDAVVETVEASASITNPADCKKLATLRFLEQSLFREGREALTRCEGDAKNSNDDEGDVESVEVSNVEIEGPRATADAAFHGGAFDGQTFSVVVIEEDGSWKMGEIAGFKEFNQEKLLRSLEEQFDAEGIEPEVVSCMGEEFRKLPRPKIEQLMIGGSSKPFLKTLVGCQ
jgi:hypothetical protein